MKRTGRTLVFTGDGKGKTTAALGMAVRASGHGLRTLIVQFIKSDAPTGENTFLESVPEIEIVQTGLGFVPPRSDPGFIEHQRSAQQGLQMAALLMASGNYDLVILDEICTALARNLLEEDAVIKTLEQANGSLSIVMTGRGATHNLISLADTVTEMRCVKHGYETGWPAQRGVEF